MRMNDLHSCIENAVPTTEQKQRMLSSILERKNENGGIEIMKSRTKRFTMAVAAAALAVLMTTVVLAVSNGWHESFTQYFGINPEQTALLEGAVGSPEISVTDNGVTVKVLQTLADSMGVYVLFEVTVPEDMELTDDITFGRNSLHADVEMCTDGTSIGVFGTDFLEISGNRITAIACNIPGDPIADGTLRLHLTDIGYINRPIDIGLGSGNPFMPLIEGEWVLEWEFTYVDTAKKITPNRIVGADSDALVTEISISPVSIRVTGEGMKGCSLEGLSVRGDIIVTFKDGRTISYSAKDERSLFSGSGASTADGGMHYVYRMFNRFDRIIDPDDVESVTVLDVVIPTE